MIIPWKTFLNAIPLLFYFCAYIGDWGINSMPRPVVVVDYFQLFDASILIGHIPSNIISYVQHGQQGDPLKSSLNSTDC